MKKIECWITDDGEIFTDENDAIHHEHQNKLYFKFEEFVDRNWSCIEIYADKSDVVKMLYDHNNELFEILNG